MKANRLPGREPWDRKGGEKAVAETCEGAGRFSNTSHTLASFQLTVDLRNALFDLHGAFKSFKFVDHF